MRQNIRKVIVAFRQGKAAKGDSRGTCSTDGGTIYSYSTPIAWSAIGGLVRVTKESFSRTTNSQIAAIKFAFAGEIACDHSDCWRAGPEMLRACAKSRR